MGSGPLFNCSSKQPNMRMIKVFSYTYGPEALFIATKKIPTNK
jgi:hypothetical protein